MATATRTSCLGEIGETAGRVWHLLDVKGPQTLAKLVKEFDDVPRTWLCKRWAGWRGKTS